MAWCAFAKSAMWNVSVFSISSLAYLQVHVQNILKIEQVQLALVFTHVFSYLRMTLTLT